MAYQRPSQRELAAARKVVRQQEMDRAIAEGQLTVSTSVNRSPRRMRRSTSRRTLRQSTWSCRVGVAVTETKRPSGVLVVPSLRAARRRGGGHGGRTRWPPCPRRVVTPTRPPDAVVSVRAEIRGDAMHLKVENHSCSSASSSPTASADGNGARTMLVGARLRSARGVVAACPRCCGLAWQTRDPPGRTQVLAGRSPPTRVCRRCGGHPNAAKAPRPHSGQNRRHVAGPGRAGRSTHRYRGWRLSFG
jgi:hypothetical protein